MRQRSSRESSTPPLIKPLHSVLETALSSLDVQLEEELSRYRRTRQGKPARTGSRRGRSRDSKPMDTIYVEAKGGRTKASSASAIAVPAGAKPVSPVPPPPPSQIKRSEAASPNAQMAIAATSLTAQAEQVSLSTPPADAETAQKLANPDDLNLGPDDYLESSEELLKSLDDQDVLPQEREPGFVQSLLTPLGIGSMLLLLLSSVTLGYLIMNPASLGVLSQAETGTGSDRNSEFSGEAAVNPNLDDSPNGAIPGSPDLATEEFRELNLSTLSTLPTGSAASQMPVTPGVVPSPTLPVPSTSLQPSTPLPTPQSATLPSTVVPATASMRPGRRSASTQASVSAAAPRPAARSTPARSSAPAQPSPARSAPAQTNTARTAQPPAVQAQPASPPAVAASAPANSPPPGQDGYYYVTTPYSGDRSLEQVRQSVGDAYVRNLPEGGAQVQVGAFRDQAGAEDLVNELEQQGIPAEVHQP